MTLLSCWILITLLNFDTFLSHNSTGRRYTALYKRVRIPRWNMTPGQNSALNCDPNPMSHFHFDPNQGHNWTLNHDSGSQCNVELRPGIIIQLRIKTLGHNSTGGGGGVKYNDLCLGAIQHEKSVESWAQPVELRPHGSKFNGVKIQSYTSKSFNHKRVVP